MEIDWVKRVSELRQMVEDLPDAPRTVDDVDFYMDSPEFFGIDEFNQSDREFLRREIFNRYKVKF